MLPLNSIYHDAKLYDDIHWWKNDDIDFWRNIYHETPGSKVLELACGTGRLAPCLLEDGARYTGLELSPFLAEGAKNNLKNYSSVNIVTGDMRNFQLNEKFDLIIVGFNAFLHLLADHDASACLMAVKNHMHSTSRFLIDVFIPNPLFLYRPEGVRFPVLEFTHSTTEELITVEESNMYDTDTEINHLTWYFSSKDIIDFARRKFSIRMFFPSKLNCMLIDAGFEISHQWGDYYRTPLGAGSKLQIYDACLP
ncbi:MAG: methyltransferase domain-containing protein [Candidatus Marinimicrobia bacterium]|nr:methyltransferase domain-containing protein [Candidatus Neomarinimicrobiota bacterium]